MKIYVIVFKQIKLLFKQYYQMDPNDYGLHYFAVSNKVYSIDLIFEVPLLTALASPKLRS